MDALALLCTLHADGPATLKRLRARGYSDLVTLIQRSASDLSVDLDVEPAFARRLLREAKLLAVRVGAEGLEAEEAPPIVTPRESVDLAPVDAEAVASVPRSIPIVAPVAGDMASELNESDRSLVERIVAAPKMEEPFAAAVTPPAAAPAQVFAEEPEALAPEALAPEVLEPHVEPEAEPVAVEPVEICSLEAAALPGLDADLIFDLKASGISTIEELAQADSLQLTRALGVTFAQARRLGFLARRSAAALSAAQPQSTQEPAPAKRTRTSRREAPALEAPAPAVTAPQAEIALPQVTLAPHRRPSPEAVAEVTPKAKPVVTPAPEPRALTAPLAPTPRPIVVTPIPAEPMAAEPVAATPAAHVEAPAREPVETPEPRKPFWEPRGFLTDSAEAKAAPQQGVKVDPAEIAPRPRFGDRLAHAAEQERQRTSNADASQANADSPGHTVLGWNFEIPRPADEPSLPLGSLDIPAEEDPAQVMPAPGSHGDQDRGGPFA